MINVEAVRRLLAVADVNKDPYAVADVAGALLAVNREDPAALASYARALSALGLLSAAQRVIAESRGNINTGLVAWKSRARRFGANLAALAHRNPAGAAMVEEAAKELERYELHIASDGNFQILDTAREMPDAWLAGFAMHKAGESLWKYDRTQGPPAAVAFESLGFGWLFLKVLATTERTFLNYSCAIYVLEGDPLGLAMLFHMHDLQESIRQERVRWFIGTNAAEAAAAFRRALETNHSWNLPAQFIRCPLRGQSPMQWDGVFKEISESRARRRERFIAEARAWYAAKDAEYWRKRYDDALSGRDAPLRVLGITSRYTTVLQYSMAELCAAVQDAGYDMRVAIEPDDSSVENPYEQMIAEFKPDLIVQISRMRYENPTLPANVPFLCWDQDNLPCMRTEKATASLDALTYVAGQGAAYGYTFLGWPRQNVIFCESAGATFRYSEKPVGENILAPYRCDVSFVSNASGLPAEMQAQQRASWKHHADAAAVYEDVSSLIIQAADSGGTWEYHSLLREMRKVSSARGVRLAPAVEKEIIVSLILLSDRCFRHAALHWIRRWCEKAGKRLRLYGRGWDTHPDFAKYAAGYAQQGEGLAAIYQASKINLHLMESGGFFHSRPLDGIAAGGFFLTRTSPNDGVDMQRVEAQRVLADRATFFGLSTKRDIEQCGDPEIAAAWEVMAPFFADLGPQERITGLSLWNELPPPRVVFPQLPRISFSTAAEFEQLAAWFLENDSERNALARSMRDVLERKMSYACRWTQFLDGVRSGLNAAVASAQNESLLAAG